MHPSCLKALWQPETDNSQHVRVLAIDSDKVPQGPGLELRRIPQHQQGRIHGLQFLKHFQTNLVMRNHFMDRTKSLS